MTLFQFNPRAYLFLPDEGLCYFSSTRNNRCEFLASYGVIFQSVIKPFFKKPVFCAPLSSINKMTNFFHLSYVLKNLNNQLVTFRTLDGFLQPVRYLVLLNGFIQPVTCFQYFWLDLLYQVAILILLGGFTLASTFLMLMGGFTPAVFNWFFGWIYTFFIDFWMNLH